MRFAFLAVIIRMCAVTPKKIFVSVTESFPGFIASGRSSVISSSLPSIAYDVFEVAKEESPIESMRSGGVSFRNSNPRSGVCFARPIMRFACFRCCISALLMKVCKVTTSLIRSPLVISKKVVHPMLLVVVSFRSASAEEKDAVFEQDLC